jgi:hypothetical protein
MIMHGGDFLRDANARCEVKGASLTSAQISGVTVTAETVAYQVSCLSIPFNHRKTGSYCRGYRGTIRAFDSKLVPYYELT